MDVEDIFDWTQTQFGEAQALAYLDTLSAALESLADGPNVTGARPRDEIAKGLRTLHVARLGRKGRHFILFRTRRDKGHDVIDILRLLHDSMDLARHIQLPGQTE